MIDIVWDMETNDPDDFITLLMLVGHPRVNLKAVTLVPGTPAQVGLIRHALREWFQMDVPIGANLKSPKKAVSDWHYLAYGEIPESHEAESPEEILRQYCDTKTTLLTGAALTNLRAAILKSKDVGTTFTVGQVVIQGGFAGDGVVPPELQMEKFRGLRTCPTHNLMADKKAAHLVLEHTGFGIRRFVSKNVCHRVVYDNTMHQQIGAVKSNSLALAKIWEGMNVYLKQVNPSGKMLHDPLAAACAIDATVGTWAEVELFREGNEWGANLAPHSNTWITTDYNHERFIGIFTAY